MVKGVDILAKFKKPIVSVNNKESVVNVKLENLKNLFIIKSKIIFTTTVKPAGKAFLNIFFKKFLVTSSLEASKARIKPGIPIVVAPIRDIWIGIKG